MGQERSEAGYISHRETFFFLNACFLSAFSFYCAVVYSSSSRSISLQQIERASSRALTVNQVEYPLTLGMPPTFLWLCLQYLSVQPHLLGVVAFVWLRSSQLKYDSFTELNLDN